MLNKCDKTNKLLILIVTVATQIIIVSSKLSYMDLVDIMKNSSGYAA